MTIAGLYLDTAATAAQVIADPAVAAAWTAPSALLDMAVGELAGHVSRSITHTGDAFASPVSTDEPLSTVEYYIAGGDPADHDSRSSRRVRETSAEEAAGGHAALCRRVDAALEHLRVRLPDDDLDVAHDWFARCTTRRTILEARILEMVVHIDDLAASVTLQPFELPPDAIELTVDLLIGMARARFTPMEALRALARRERAAGVLRAF